MIIIKGGFLVGNRLWIFLALSWRHFFFFKNKFKKRLIISLFIHFITTQVQIPIFDTKAEAKLGGGQQKRGKSIFSQNLFNQTTTLNLSRVHKISLTTKISEKLDA
jgi:hypothetical protein